MNYKTLPYVCPGKDQYRVTAFFTNLGVRVDFSIDPAAPGAIIKDSIEAQSYETHELNGHTGTFREISSDDTGHRSAIPVYQAAYSLAEELAIKALNKR